MTTVLGAISVGVSAVALQIALGSAFLGLRYVNDQGTLFFYFVVYCINLFLGIFFLRIGAPFLLEKEE